MLEVQGSASYETGILPDVHGPFSQSASKQRVLRLSASKENKKIWVTSFGPKLYWGDQDMMWPISEATLKARPTQRLIQLAVAKKNFQRGTNRVNRPHFTYSCGRTSPVWEISKDAFSASSTKRIDELSKPKETVSEYLENRHMHQYSCGRVSPIWQVQKPAIRCPSRARTAKLAEAKQPHPEYEPNREVESVISPKAIRGMGSERVNELARPKTRSPGPFVDSRSPEDSIWKVNPGARAATASPRIMELAKFKGFADGFIPNRGVYWPVSRATRRAVITPRSEELAKPKIRAPMSHVQFNPAAFLVSPLAMKARCTQRLEELSQPIQR